MPTYLIHFKANPSAWPSDPAEVAAIWEGVMAGANQLLEQGVVEQIGWVSNIEGYAMGATDDGGHRLAKLRQYRSGDKSKDQRRSYGQAGGKKRA